MYVVFPSNKGDYVLVLLEFSKLLSNISFEPVPLYSLVWAILWPPKDVYALILEPTDMLSCIAKCTLQMCLIKDLMMRQVP